MVERYFNDTLNSTLFLYLRGVVHGICKAFFALNSTLFLYLPMMFFTIGFSIIFFKFHSVSISTKPCEKVIPYVCTLNSTLFLYLRRVTSAENINIQPLNSTLFLYLRLSNTSAAGDIEFFKFHSVSISTGAGGESGSLSDIFKFHSVSIST